MDSDSVYIFTDGVTESIDEHNRLLKVDGLIKLIETKSTIPASRRLEDIVAMIKHPDIDQPDDITLMVIECCMR